MRMGVDVHHEHAIGLALPDPPFHTNLRPRVISSESDWRPADTIGVTVGDDRLRYEQGPVTAHMGIHPVSSPDRLRAA